jgi:hypothetical protein
MVEGITKEGNRYRKLTSVLLAGVLACGTVAAPVAALADDGTAGTVTINGNSTNPGGYSAYKIFSGDVTAGQTPANKLANIDWASTNMAKAVMNSINSIKAGTFDKTELAITATGNDASMASAQKAAQWMHDNVTGGADGTDSTKVNTDRSVTNKNLQYDAAAKKIANAVYAAGDAAAYTLTAGQAASFADGYYVIVNTASVTGTDEMGTAPIFTTAGGAPVTAIEKTSTPTVKKEVTDDATGAKLATVADADTGQNLAYTLTGTIASNFNDFDDYYYQFTDTLSGLDMQNSDTSSVKVAVDGKDVTTKAKIAYNKDAGKLTVAFDDLKDCGVALTTASKVVVTYNAHLTAAASTAAAGNDNTVALTYASDPMNNSHATTKPDSVKTHAYKLHLQKQDRSTNKALAGAQFTIQQNKGDEGTTMYVKADGSLTANKADAILSTNDSGVLEVSGLDVGTYTLHEETVPANYNAVPDSTFTIAATYNNNDATATLTNTVAGGKDAFAGQLVFAGLGNDQASANAAKGDNATAIASSGVVNVTVEDVKTVEMPLTGEQGIMLIEILGVGVVGISVAAAMRNRRKDASQSQVQA